jgi:hypothetical protein
VNCLYQIREFSISIMQCLYYDIETFLNWWINYKKYKSSRVSNWRPLTLLTTCLISLPTRHYMFMFLVLFFWVVYYASKINKIVSLVNQKMSIEMLLQDIAIFKMSQKCLSLWHLTRCLKQCLYSHCDTLFLRYIPKCHKNMSLWLI